MSKARFLVIPLTALIIIGLLIAGGLAIHRIGWAEGYRVGQLAADVGDGGVTPYALYGFGSPFITILLVLLFVIVIGKFFRLLAWRMVWGPHMMPVGPWKMGGGPRGAHWARHWHAHHGRMPSWCRDWEESSEEKTEKAEPDTGTEAAEAKN
jgi:hypothetical protein